MKINNIRSGCALGEGSRDFGSKMMENEKIENMKIKYSEEKKNLLQLMFIKEEDIGSLTVHKTLTVLDIVYLDARNLREKTNHLNSSFLICLSLMRRKYPELYLLSMITKIR